MMILVALYMKSICSSMDQLSKSNKSIVISLGATHLLRLNRGSSNLVQADSPERWEGAFMINTAGVRAPARGLPHPPVDIVTQADPLGPRRPGCGVASGRRDVAEPLTPADSRERRLYSRLAAGATHKVEGERFIRHIVAGLKFLRSDRQVFSTL